MAMGLLLGLIICILFSITFKGLRAIYFGIPELELSRRAGRGKQFYKNIQKVNSYGKGARGFFSVSIFIFAGTSIIIMARVFDPWIALILFAVYGYVLQLAATQNWVIIKNLANFTSPYLIKMFDLFKPIASKVKHLPVSKGKKSIKTDIYEKEDLRQLLERQKVAINNRIEPEILNRLAKELEFEASTIKKQMVKKSEIHFVNNKEPIGPILLSELHKSGYSCFPVKGNSENEVLGMLYMRDLAQHTEGGVVSEAMDDEVFYVQEDQTLEHVLQAFSFTGSRVFMVVNVREEISGLITVKDVLEQVVGHSLQSDFEDYKDPAAVAHL